MKMKTKFITLITMLVLCLSTAFGQLAKPLNGSDWISLPNFSTTTTDTIYWLGPYDVSACWSPTGSPISAAVTNDSSFLDLGISAQASSVAGAATVTITAYLTPTAFAPPARNLLSGSAASAPYGLTFIKMCGSDSVTLTAITADGDTASSQIALSKSIANPPKSYLYFSVYRPNDKPVDTKGYIQVACIDRKRYR